MDERSFAKAFGMHLKRLRRRRGISQEKLAERSSLSRTSIVNIEAGRQGVALTTLYRLAGALTANPCDLLPEVQAADAIPSIAIGPEGSDSSQIIQQVLRDLETEA